VVRPAVAPSRKPRALVGGGPDRVAHALEAEHRVVDVEGQHRHAVRAVAGGRGRPAGQRAGLADTLLEDLAVQGLAVAQHRADVLGLVALAGAGVDAHLLEQVGHAEGARLVGDDGHHARAERGVLQQRAQQAHEGHRRRHLLARGLQREAGHLGQRRHRHRRGGGLARRQVAAQRGAARVQVDDLGAVVGRTHQLQRLRLLVAQRQREAVAEG